MQTRGENPVIALVRLVKRNRRRYGGYIIHLGVIMIALGFIGDTFFKQETQATLAPGQTLSLGGYTLRYDGLVEYPGSDGRDIVEANTTLLKDGQVLRELHPRQDYFTIQKQPSTVAAVYSTPGEDVYVLLAGWETLSADATTFKIYLNSLINWIWIGGGVLVLGMMIAVWPKGKKQAAPYVLKPDLATTPRLQQEVEG
jgi:cytochrome c-type biogenesis protein CcmF